MLIIDTKEKIQDRNNGLWTFRDCQLLIKLKEEIPGVGSLIAGTLKRINGKITDDCRWEIVTDLTKAKEQIQMKSITRFWTSSVDKWQVIGW